MSIAMEAYAYRSMLVMFTETRWRSIRRIGQEIAKARAEGRLATGTRGCLVGKKPGTGTGKAKGKGKAFVKITKAPTLPEQGVDKHLAALANRYAAMTQEAFDAELAQAVAAALKAS